MSEDNLPQRTIKTTTFVVLFFSAIFAARSQVSISLGLAIGGALGVFSLWSLALVVPRLFSSSSPASKFLLGMLGLAKLPIFAGTLYFAMASPLVSPFAVFVGVALTPVVVVLKTIGSQVVGTTALSAGD